MGWLWVLLIILLLSAVIFFASALVFRKYTGRSDAHVYTTEERAPDRYKPYVRQYLAADAGLKEVPCEEVSLRSDDGLRLCGKLYRTKPENHRVVLCMHGYHAGGLYDMARFSRLYRELGLDFLIISQRCHERSEGTYITFGYKESRDGMAWCRFLLERYGADVRILLHGMSMGATSALLMTGSPELPHAVRACISDCAYADMKQETLNYFRKYPRVVQKSLLFLMNFWGKHRAGYTLQNTSALDAVSRAKIPALFIHGSADKFVPTVQGRELYDAYAGPKDLLEIPGAAHCFSYTVDPEKYDRKVRGFLRIYFPDEQRRAQASAEHFAVKKTGGKGGSAG